MIRQLLTISRNTFTESIRQPVFTVLLIVAALVFLLLPAASAFTMDDDNKFLIDMGLGTLLGLGSLQACLTATGVLVNELELKTALTVISKPVSRTVFIVGKFAGVAASLGLMFWVMSMLFFMTVRHGVLQTASEHFDMPVITLSVAAWVLALVGAGAGNYLYRWSFPSAFAILVASMMTLAAGLVLVIGKDWGFQPIVTEFRVEGALASGQRAIAVAMMFDAVLIVAAVAVAAATRLGMIMTLMIGVGFWALGLISGGVLGPWKDTYWFAKVLYMVIPNLQFMWQADALAMGYKLTVESMLYVTGYAGLYVLGFLALGVGLFQTRDLG